MKHERKYHKISQSRAELAFALSPSLIASGENYQPDTSIHLTSEAQVLNALELENAASSANLEPASSISGLNIRTISGSATEQRGFNNFLNGLECPNSSSNGLSNELDDLLSCVAGQDSPSNGLSNRFCSWPVEPSGFPNGIAGQGNFSNGLSNELDDFLNHVAGQDSSSNGLSNRLCSWPVGHGGLPDGISGQSSCSDGFSGWPGEHGGLPDGVAGPNSPGNGLSNGLGGLVFNGLEGPNALPDGVGGDRSCVSGFLARPGPH